MVDLRVSHTTRSRDWVRWDNRIKLSKWGRTIIFPNRKSIIIFFYDWWMNLSNSFNHFMKFITKLYFLIYSMVISILSQLLSWPSIECLSNVLLFLLTFSSLWMPLYAFSRIHCVLYTAVKKYTLPNIKHWMTQRVLYSIAFYMCRKTFNSENLSWGIYNFEKKNNFFIKYF